MRYYMEEITRSNKTVYRVQDSDGTIIAEIRDYLIAEELLKQLNNPVTQTHALGHIATCMKNMINNRS